MFRSVFGIIRFVCKNNKNPGWEQTSGCFYSYFSGAKYYFSVAEQYFIGGE